MSLFRHSRKLSRRVLFALVAAPALFWFLWFAPKLPKDQTVRITLGEAAPEIQELRLRYASPYADNSENWLREVAYSFEKAAPAPSVLVHELRLPDGEYTLEIESSAPPRHAQTKRTVSLLGSTTKVDVSKDLRLQ